MSEEWANFSNRTHQCITLQGSSGSSLRDIQSGKVVGVHTGGIVDQHNSFIPITELTIKQITEKII